MIKITVELYPLGLDTNKKILGTMKIFNDGTGTKTKGNYGYQINLSNKWKEGKVKDFPRKRLNVWHLIFRVLLDAIGLGNGRNIYTSK